MKTSIFILMEMEQRRGYDREDPVAGYRDERAAEAECARRNAIRSPEGAYYELHRLDFHETPDGANVGLVWQNRHLNQVVQSLTKQLEELRKVKTRKPAPPRYKLNYNPGASINRRG